MAPRQAHVPTGPRKTHCVLSIQGRRSRCTPGLELSSGLEPSKLGTRKPGMEAGSCLTGLLVLLRHT
eukprot:1153122-Pelagomonas_calceolata.AAC.4